MKKQMIVAVGMVALLLAAASPFANMETPVYAAGQGEAVKAEMKTLAQLDKNVVEAARQAMQKQASGIPIELDRISGENADCWVISAKDSRGEVLVTKKEGKVVFVKVTLKFNEVAANLQNTVTSTLKGMDAKRAYVIDSVERINWEKENDWQFNGKDVSVSIDAQTGKVNTASLRYTAQQMNAKVVETAHKTLKSLSNGNTQVLLPDVTLVKDTQRHWDQVWSFMDSSRTYSIIIGAKTGKVVSATIFNEFSNDNYVSDEDIPKVFAKPFYTKEKAIVAVNPMMKKVFNLDLSGYNVSSKYNEYTFTKKGKPTVIASINKKGVFYDFTVTPENGLIN
ncbi:hypothetical protein J31TS6_55630 [Brevibacillus reuszeri]|uniref:hypothetical protein n=1 Tax=Brevibacillus reuszeri TaxID=54915 RepID=UPI001B2328EB|nr:hypothetical protein [Brevibacillus reuszeri]GIO09535.1 hypothetical protein J31TS6_55630 [Brevibacillus reuszeri]